MRGSHAIADGASSANDAPAAAVATPGSGSPGLAPAVAEMVALFADLAGHLGLPRSVGQIFGLAYATPGSVTFADIVAQLGISKGSASQGLRFLRELGALKLVEPADPSDRREHYVPELSLRRLLTGVLEDRVQAPLAAGNERLDTLERAVAELPGADGEFLRQRVGSLRTWHRKARLFLPFLQTFLGPKRGAG